MGCVAGRRAYRAAGRLSFARHAASAPRGSRTRGRLTAYQKDRNRSAGCSCTAGHARCRLANACLRSRPVGHINRYLIAIKLLSNYYLGESCMNTVAAPRRPWLAALLSLVLPGFGQFYVGDANRALGFFLAFAILGIPVVIIVSLYLPIELTAVSVALATLASVGVWVYAVVDAWRMARRSDPFVPAGWQTRTVYTSVFLLTAFVLLPLVIGYVRQHLVQPFRIPGSSMSPTLQSGDMIFADMSYNCPTCFKPVKRGDVAIFVYPDNRTQYFVKRIVALPGDTIRIDAGEVIINGTPSPDAFSGDQTVNMDEHKVAPGHVFVLGDNRTASRDSRDFDDVPLSDVVGRPRQIWFSHGEDGVRWDRIGQAVQGAP